VDLPALVNGPGHRRGHVGRFRGAQLVGPGTRGMGLAPQDRNGWAALGGGPRRDQGDEVGLARSGQGHGRDLAHESAEGGVDPCDDRPDGSEVGRELHPAARGPEAAGGTEERRNVGSAEPVDGLLGVAHHEQVPRGHLHLVPRGRPRPPAYVGPAQQGAGQHQQVVELELTGGPAFCRRLQREKAQDGGYLPGTGLGQLTSDGAQARLTDP